jgi:hypothetical protein
MMDYTSLLTKALPPAQRLDHIYIYRTWELDSFSFIAVQYAQGETLARAGDPLFSGETRSSENFESLRFNHVIKIEFKNFDYRTGWTMGESVFDYRQWGDFFVPHRSYTGSGTHPALYPKGGRRGRGFFGIKSPWCETYP